VIIQPTWKNNPDINRLFELFTAHRFQLFIVGGWIRDCVLNIPAHDLDLATDATPNQILKMITPYGLKHNSNFSQYGTVLLGADNISVTTFREDINPQGRQTDVKFSKNLETDANRRDFTINALYATYEGRIIDPLNGLDDLINGRVKFIGHPYDRISEDYLRVLRFFRFTAAYGNANNGFDPDGLSAVKRIDIQKLRTLSPERVRHEVLRLVTVRPLYWCLKSIEKTPIWSWLFPQGNSQNINRLEKIEKEYGLNSPTILNLAILGVQPYNPIYALTRSESQYLEIMRKLLNSRQKIDEIAYRHGVDLAKDFHLVQAVLSNKAIATDFIERITLAAKQTFPITSSDLSRQYKGEKLGQTLKEIEQTWIDSQFTLKKEELLDKYL